MMKERVFDTNIDWYKLWLRVMYTQVVYVLDYNIIDYFSIIFWIFYSWMCDDRVRCVKVTLKVNSECKRISKYSGSINPSVSAIESFWLYTVIYLLSNLSDYEMLYMTPIPPVTSRNRWSKILCSVYRSNNFLKWRHRVYTSENSRYPEEVTYHRRRYAQTNGNITLIKPGT